MKTINSRHLFPLAAIALIAAGCDPFPAAPGGDPAIVRIISADEDWAFHSVTVENTGAPGTVVMNQAYPLDRIYVQFNKPMNGLTLQKYPDYDANGNKTDPATLPAPDQATGVCTKPDNLTSTFPANTTFCYYPSSVTDGAQLVVGAVTDQDDNRGAWIVAGTVYTITGNVTDYEGKTLAINVSVSLDTTPYTTTGDPLRAPGLGRTYSYGFWANWFPVAGDTGYQVAYAEDDGTGTEPAAGSAAWIDPTAGAGVPTTACGQSTFPTVPTTTLGSVVCQTSINELPASTDYWFRVRATGATAWSVSQLQSTRAPMVPTLTNFSDPTVTPPVISDNAVNVAWGRYFGTVRTTGTPAPFPAAPDRPVVVERITDDGTRTAPSPTATGWAPVTLVAIDDVVNGGFLFRQGADLTTTKGTGYWYRVRPDYAVTTTVFVGTAVYKLSN